MSWISKRQTTRIEDMAYCMLGIFDIHMPLMYGEGAKAFLRLQEEIAKQTCDLSLFAWTTPLEVSNDRSPLYSGIFATSPKHFADCQHILHTNNVTPNNEFTVTNKGVRIETTLVELFDGEDSIEDLVLNLGVSYSKSEPKPIGSDWMGIYVRRSAFGFVRVRPGRLCLSGYYHRSRCPRSVIYLRKQVGELDMVSLQHQYRRAIQILPLPGGVRILRAQPSELFDTQKQLFLDPGNGLNIYLTFEVRATRRHREFRGLLACSTMGIPTCTLCTERDRSWGPMCAFLADANEVTDYTATDYLLNQLVPRNTEGRRVAMSDYLNRIAGYRVKLQARLSEASFAGDPGYAVELRILAR